MGTEKTATDYRVGDKVFIELSGGRVPWIRGGRVVRVYESTGTFVVNGVIWESPDLNYATVTGYSTRAWISSWRVIPPGTPMYFVYGFSELQLVESDPTWNPFRYSPPLSPDKYETLAGKGHWGKVDPAMSQIGAYPIATTYGPGDPLWAWDGGSWRAAEVVGTGSGAWVPVRFLAGYRDRKGHSGKSFRPNRLWPVLSDFPTALPGLTDVSDASSGENAVNSWKRWVSSHNQRCAWWWACQ
jgi:hypothetical protein